MNNFDPYSLDTDDGSAPVFALAEPARASTARTTPIAEAVPVSEGIQFTRANPMRHGAGGNQEQQTMDEVPSYSQAMKGGMTMQSTSIFSRTINISSVLAQSGADCGPYNDRLKSYSSTGVSYCAYRGVNACFATIAVNCFVRYLQPIAFSVLDA